MHQQPLDWITSENFQNFGNLNSFGGGPHFAASGNNDQAGSLQGNNSGTSTSSIPFLVAGPGSGAQLNRGLGGNFNPGPGPQSNQDLQQHQVGGAGGASSSNVGTTSGQLQQHHLHLGHTAGTPISFPMNSNDLTNVAQLHQLAGVAALPSTNHAQNNNSPAGGAAGAGTTITASLNKNVLLPLGGGGGSGSTSIGGNNSGSCNQNPLQQSCNQVNLLLQLQPLLNNLQQQNINLQQNTTTSNIDSTTTNTMNLAAQQLLLQQGQQQQQQLQQGGQGHLQQQQLLINPIVSTSSSSVSTPDGDHQQFPTSTTSGAAAVLTSDLNAQQKQELVLSSLLTLQPGGAATTSTTIMNTTKPPPSTPAAALAAPSSCTGGDHLVGRVDDRDVGPHDTQEESSSADHGPPPSSSISSEQPLGVVGPPPMTPGRPTPSGAAKNKYNKNINSTSGNKKRGTTTTSGASFRTSVGQNNYNYAAPHHNNPSSAPAADDNVHHTSNCSEGINKSSKQDIPPFGGRVKIGLQQQKGNKGDSTGGTPPRVEHQSSGIGAAISKKNDRSRAFGEGALASSPRSSSAEELYQEEVRLLSQSGLNLEIGIQLRRKTSGTTPRGPELFRKNSWYAGEVAHADLLRQISLEMACGRWNKLYSSGRTADRDAARYKRWAGNIKDGINSEDVYFSMEEQKHQLNMFDVRGRGSSKHEGLVVLPGRRGKERGAPSGIKSLDEVEQHGKNTSSTGAENCYTSSIKNLSSSSSSSHEHKSLHVPSRASEREHRGDGRDWRDNHADNYNLSSGPGKDYRDYVNNSTAASAAGTSNMNLKDPRRGSSGKIHHHHTGAAAGAASGFSSSSYSYYGRGGGGEKGAGATSSKDQVGNNYNNNFNSYGASTASSSSSSSGKDKHNRDHHHQNWQYGHNGSKDNMHHGSYSSSTQQQEHGTSYQQGGQHHHPRSGSYSGGHYGKDKENYNLYQHNKSSYNMMNATPTEKGPRGKMNYPRSGSSSEHHNFTSQNTSPRDGIIGTKNNSGTGTGPVHKGGSKNNFSYNNSASSGTAGAGSSTAMNKYSEGKGTTSTTTTQQAGATTSSPLTNSYNSFNPPARGTSSGNVAAGDGSSSSSTGQLHGEGLAQEQQPTGGDPDVTSSVSTDPLQHSVQTNSEAGVSAAPTLGVFQQNSSTSKDDQAAGAYNYTRNKSSSGAEHKKQDEEKHLNKKNIIIKPTTVDKDANHAKEDEEKSQIHKTESGDKHDKVDTTSVLEPTSSSFTGENVQDSTHEAAAHAAQVATTSKGLDDVDAGCVKNEASSSGRARAQEAEVVGPPAATSSNQNLLASAPSRLSNVGPCGPSPPPMIPPALPEHDPQLPLIGTTMSSSSGASTSKTSTTPFNNNNATTTATSQQAQGQHQAIVPPCLPPDLPELSRLVSGTAVVPPLSKAVVTASTIASSSSSSSALEENQQQHAAAMAKLHKKLEEFEEAQSKQKDEMKKLKEQVASLNSELSRTNKQLATEQQEKQKWVKQAEEWKEKKIATANNKAADQNKQLQDRMKASKQECSELKKKMEVMTIERKEANRESESVLKKMEDLKKQIENLHLQHQKEVDKNENLRKENQEAEASLREELKAEYEAQLADNMQKMQIAHDNKYHKKTIDFEKSSKADERKFKQLEEQIVKMAKQATRVEREHKKALQEKDNRWEKIYTKMRTECEDIVNGMEKKEDALKDILASHKDMFIEKGIPEPAGLSSIIAGPLVNKNTGKIIDPFKLKVLREKERQFTQNYSAATVVASEDKNAGAATSTSLGGDTNAGNSGAVDNATSNKSASTSGNSKNRKKNKNKDSSSSSSASSAATTSGAGPAASSPSMTSNTPTTTVGGEQQQLSLLESVDQLDFSQVFCGQSKKEREEYQQLILEQLNAYITHQNTVQSLSQTRGLQMVSQHRNEMEKERLRDEIADLTKKLSKKEQEVKKLLQLCAASSSSASGSSKSADKATASKLVTFLNENLCREHGA
ncbi:unnamed protein product [Amoebophrya sp. A120]|nr:unnamed protein product [Amoebophrya sp. A120]|eukprot:GSA120T00014178001.1